MYRQLSKILAALRGAAATARRRSRFVPGLENLEHREVPATFNVTTVLDVVNPNDGKLSLREAVSRANANPGGDTIVLRAGTYRVALMGLDDTNAAGDLDVTGTTLFQGAGAASTIIDGEQIDRVFDIHGTAPHSIKVNFQGLTVRNGSAGGDGGGIRVGNADLQLTDCVVTRNSAEGNGGGISNAAQPGTGSVRLLRTVVDRNVAGLLGGGLYVVSIVPGKGSVLTVNGGAIRHNLATQGAGIDAVTATLTGSTVTANFATGDGGGIEAHTATLTNCTVSGNHADSGGGISGDVATLTGSTVRGNTAHRFGGGIRADKVTLTRTVVSGNHAAVSGGGIGGGKVTLTDSGVTGNSAAEDAGGGISATVVALTRTAVTGNTSNGGGGIFADTATLTDSNADGNFAVTNGGGIHANTVILTRSTVNGNHAVRSGGGIYGTTATLTGSTVSGNSAAMDGGGITVSTATLSHTTVTDNRAGGDGGGISATTATLTLSSVNNNAAGGGGAGLSVGTATLTNSTVAGNSAVGDGGGIDADSATLTGSTVSGNSAINGGGFELFSVNLTNCTVSGNSAFSGNSALGGHGGGIDAATSVTLLNTTITDNSAHYGAGVACKAMGTSNVRNSIIAGNLVDFQGFSPDLDGTFTSGGHNLIGDRTGAVGFVDGVNGDRVGTSTNPLDPLLAPLANNGGPTRTHALLPGSLAIDHGDNTNAPSTDQRGVRRPRDGDGNGSRIADIGAFEL